MKVKKPKVLYYDIETTPLLAYIWRCGKQVVRPGQLHKQQNTYDIICITYCWNDGKPAKELNWNYKEQDSGPMIEAFDKLIKQADITIGKNSDSFDVKHINTLRMLKGLPGMPDWNMYTDDLQKQMRRHFYLPSYALDYFSDILGYGGKVKMEFSDWIHIVEQTRGEGPKRFKKMLKYGMKDVEDTRALWEHCEKHFQPRFNAGNLNEGQACKTCGSANIRKNGTRYSGKTKYQTYYCNDHHGYAGRAPIRKDGTSGKLS